MPIQNFAFLFVNRWLIQHIVDYFRARTTREIQGKVSFSSFFCRVEAWFDLYNQNVYI